jgi:hypothetical protein
MTDSTRFLAVLKRFKNNIFLNIKYLKPHFSNLLLSRWRSFKRQLLTMRSHSDSKGIELKRPNDSIYSFPCPDCMCRANRTANRTNDSKSSSAAWSTHRVWRVFMLPMILWVCVAADRISDTMIVSFSLTFPSGEKAYPPFLEIKGFCWTFHCSEFWLYIWIKFQGSEWHVFMQTMLIHFRTEWKMFRCRNLSQNIERAMFRTWISSCSIEQAV